ncbi:hypothetical protein HDV00_007873 [Rhizophlyctis rosea]|nr:hypothetical protein HDV00_007873 [Rhizophlyctis rosea]
MPLLWPTIPHLVTRFPGLLPSTVITPEIYEAQMQRSQQRREKFVPQILAACQRDMDAITSKNDMSSRYMALRWAQLLAKKRAPSSDIVTVFDFFQNHLNIATAPKSEVTLWARYLGFPFPSIAPRERLMRWIDAILKDDAMIKAEGVNGLTHYELLEALDERGYMGIATAPTVNDLRNMLSDHIKFTYTAVETATRREAQEKGVVKSNTTEPKPAVTEGPRLYQVDSLGLCTVGAMVPIVRAIAARK